ncbi:hypothetical protein PFICI_13192 [Pestalotiopsis fici W106-1]|uniref:Fe2OG dioxygenase domain-containing protein n=1 Tax=Pestalotiopsis fici (strain W106-1 / CGMCC3.15140) TaxID=1229662 RepID=W3WLG7_PESFW|nr:uncharacterized protein PFICI_13192 [Pestalotiopsis fici W106-1]ETS74708.1 hypothetical protein PFICI_13192 [Pestalotiopsis fici W106-1]
MLQGIDPSLFPVLKTRKALIIIDAQNDFISTEGALHVAVPQGLTERLIRVVKGFRSYGDIVWIRSQYSQPRPPKNEQIITSDPSVAATRRPSGPRGRRPASGDDQPPSRCPEAFLSGPAPGRPECVREQTVGAQFPAEIQQLIEKKDMSFVKTYYSAFQIPDLIQRLRMKFVSEVFVCGSLTNIGIMATAIDAGSHGLDIGIVEDCCSYRDKDRHTAALNRIQKMTGCEILSTDQILDRLKPKPKVPRMAAPIPNPTGRRYPVVYEGSSATNTEDARPKPSSSAASVSKPSDLASSMTKLSLADNQDDRLPPITFSRARTAIRGNPSRPLPDIGKRLNEQFNMLGSMNASPNDDLNANSGDESPNEGPTKAADTAQPQRSARAGTLEKPVEKTRGNLESVTPSKENATTLPLSDQPPSNNESDCPTPVAALPQTNTTVIKGASEGAKVTQKQAEPIHSTEEYQRNEAFDMEPIDTNTTTSEPLCEGDTRVLYNVLPQPLAEDVFDKVREEVDWQRMSHQGGEVPRLVAVQGEVDAEGNIPVYRHPADESPPLRLWTATVKKIRDEVEKKVGHPLNHALIQFYRDGNDYISEHSDKTLDIVRGSYIVNVSLGAERTMVLRTKRQPKEQDGAQSRTSPDGSKREVQRARLPHNSMCKMGLQTNMRWLHAIRQDKRLDRDKTADELAYNGARISLTFRQIGTFLDQNQKKIWGQGAKTKSKAEAHAVVNGQSSEAIEMIKAFGKENQSTDFDWQAHYGPGFDVLHISAAPRLFTSSDPVANMRVQLMLAELGIDHAKGSSAPVSTDRGALQERSGTADIPVKFVDNDEEKSTVQGDVAIMMYLDRFYNQPDENKAPLRADVARTLTRFNEALNIGERRLTAEHADLKRWLEPWEVYAGEADFIAGASIGMADFAFWPVLYDIVEGHWDLSYRNLKSYFERIRSRETVIKIYGKDKEGQNTLNTKPDSGN